MSITNRYTQSSLSAADLDTLSAAIAQAEPITARLPRADAKIVKHLAKMGLKSEGFAREALDAARTLEAHIPRGLDLERMAAVLDSRDVLRAYMAALEQLYARVRTAVVLHGVDAYSDGLLIYNNLQKSKDMSVRETAQRLGRFFKHRKRKQKESESPDGVAPGAAPQANAPAAAVALPALTNPLPARQNPEQDGADGNALHSARQPGDPSGQATREGRSQGAPTPTDVAARGNGTPLTHGSMHPERLSPGRILTSRTPGFGPGFSGSSAFEDGWPASGGGTWSDAAVCSRRA